jgi:hypothetical protein
MGNRIMSSIIRATTTSGLQVAPDNSGSLQLQTNGTTTAVTIDTSQNVGIGTTSPSYLLNVSKNGGGSDSAQLVRFTDTSTANSIGPLHLTIGAANHFAVSPSPVLCGTNGIAFGVGDGSDLATQRKMTIDSSGNVGIGATNLQTKLTLEASTNTGTVAATPSIVLSNRNNTNATFNAAVIAVDTYRDVANPHYSGAIWFTRSPVASNLSSSSDIVFGAAENVGTSSLPTERMRITSTGLLQFDSGYGSVATAYGCRAWVNFNGTGTVAIRASGNVSSITDNGTGTYTVNFTTALVDTNYAPFTSARSYQDNDDNGIFTFPFLTHTNTTSAFRFIVAHKDAGSSGGDTPFDSTQVNVSVFR